MLTNTLWRRLVVIVSLVFVIAGCGGEGGSGNTPAAGDSAINTAGISMALRAPAEFGAPFCVRIEISGADFATLMNDRVYPAGTQVIETVMPNIPIGSDRVVEMGIFENGVCAALASADWFGRAEGVVIRNSEVTIVAMDLARPKKDGVGSVVLRGEPVRETIRLHGEVVTTNSTPIPDASCEIQESGAPIGTVVSGAGADDLGVIDTDVEVRPETLQVMLVCTRPGFANTTKLADRVPDTGATTFVATVIMNRGVSIRVIDVTSAGSEFEATVPQLELATVNTAAGEFQRIQNPENGMMMRSGGVDDVSQPEVPMLSVRVALPLGFDPSENESLIVSVEPQGEATEMQALLFPVQSPVRDARGPDGEPFAKDDETFKFDRARYDEGVADINQISVLPLSGPGDDFNVVEINMPIVNYNPSTQQLLSWPALRVKVSHPSAECFSRERVADGFEMDAVDRAIQTEIVSLSLTSVRPINVELVRKAVCPEILTPIFFGARFVIITPPAFLNAANALRAHKISHGISTVVANTTNIGSTKAQIKSYLENAYSNWFIRPKWVLLMGDSEHLPTHYDLKNSWDNAKNAGDMWYAQPTLSGLFKFLEPVTNPRFGMGRFPVDTLAQAQQMVDNVIAFENNPPPGALFGPSYYSRMTFAAQFQDNNLDGKAERAFAQTSEFIRDRLIPKNFNIQRIYRTAPLASSPTMYVDNTPVPLALRKPVFPWTGNTTDIINATNNGTSILYHRDHGWWNGWGTPSFSTGNLASISVTNNRFPVVYSVNCASGIFDNETVDLPANTEPGGYGPGVPSVYWAETAVRKSDGAIAVIGDTRSSGTWFNNDLAKGLFDATWPDVVAYGGATSIRKVGDILNHAKLYLRSERLGSDFTQTRQHMLIYNVMGDPTVEVKSKPPLTIVIGTLIFEEAVIKVPVIPEPCLTCPPFGLEPVFVVAQNLSGEMIARAVMQDGVAELDLGDFDGDEFILTASGADVDPVTETIIRPGLGDPDLVVTRFAQAGTPTLTRDGNVEVPVRMTVRNQGSTAAAIFKSSTQYTTADGDTFVAAFTVPGEAEIFYPWTDGPLGAGREVSFSGVVTFLSSLRGQTVSLTGLADSCSGDEFVPDFCRVEESDEDNNLSTAAEISLPL